MDNPQGTEQLMKRLYWVWADMVGRCSRSSHKAYKNYGGRGIKVCARWLSFNNFFEDMGKPQQGNMLDRINNDGDYEPSNCQWATRKQQNSNRRNCIYVEVNGSKVTLKEACRILNIKYRPTHKRLNRGWDIESALTLPLGSRYANR